MIDIPLMRDNISQTDISALIDFLQNSNRFTNGPKVKEFEAAWTQWLYLGGGICNSLFVNSGASANIMTLAAVRELYGEGEVILSPIGWSSDVSAVIMSGMDPVFADVSLDNMALNIESVIKKVNKHTKAILLTHVLGYNGLTDELIDLCKKKNIILIEDVCESHGAVFHGKKCGSIGDVSNFSFYYAHHMSTIEGGMICTGHTDLYRALRMYRSHGMLRECGDDVYIDGISFAYPELYPEFIFMVPGYNNRSTELNAVIGLSQLKRLDYNIMRRQENYKLFIRNLDSEKYYTDFKGAGSSNYAFVVLLRNPDDAMYKKLIESLNREKVEFRRGTAGGGNLARQPFVRKRFPDISPEDYKNAEYIHRYGLYTGNYPSLEREKILALCELLNSL